MNAESASPAPAVSAPDAATGPEPHQNFPIVDRNQRSVKADVLSGLTVALALVPEAVAFAFVAGVDPIIGLYSAFFMGLITAVLGGRPGMISGATGAMAVVVVALVAQFGVLYLFPAVILAGLLQISVGLLRLGKLIRMVPHSVMLGFVNGLAIVIGMAQLGSFKTLGTDGLMHYLEPERLGLMIALVGLTMAIIQWLPKLTKAVPSTLAAIVVVSGLAAGVNAVFPAEGGTRTAPTVKDILVDGKRAAAVGAVAREVAVTRAQAAHDLVEREGLNGPGVEVDPHPVLGHGSLDEAIHELEPAAVAAAVASVEAADVTMKAGLPRPYFMDPQYVDGEISGVSADGVAQGGSVLPPLNWATLWIILPYSLVLAGVGLIESLMTLSLIDEITETRGRGNRECIGQGIGNVTSGLFGGMGGCAMIGQSLINVKSGGRGRLSGVTAAVCLLLFVLLLAPLIEKVSIAALVGVMFMVVIGTFEWVTLRTWNKVPFSDVFVMVLVAGYTVVMHDLASAVILGVVISALVFAWKKGTHLFADTKFNEEGSKVYQLHGPLFFASDDRFKELFAFDEDPDDVVIDFYFTRVYDQSGLEAINAVTEKYAQRGKRVHLTHLSEECRALLGKAGDLVEPNISEDPHYHVATDRLA